MRSLELQSGPRINGTSSPQADRDRSSRTTDVAARAIWSTSMTDTNSGRHRYRKGATCSHRL